MPLKEEPGGQRFSTSQGASSMKESTQFFLIKCSASQSNSRPRNSRKFLVYISLDAHHQAWPFYEGYRTRAWHFRAEKLQKHRRLIVASGSISNTSLRYGRPKANSIPQFSSAAEIPWCCFIPLIGSAGIVI